MVACCALGSGTSRSKRVIVRTCGLGLKFSQPPLLALWDCPKNNGRRLYRVFKSGCLRGELSTRATLRLTRHYVADCFPQVYCKCQRLDRWQRYRIEEISCQTVGG